MGGRKADFCPARAINCLRMACIKLLTRSLLRFELCLPCFN
jgi:hypothetical protein